MCNKYYFYHIINISKKKLIMVKAISLKLEEKIFEEAETIIIKQGTSRNKYINEAVKAYNKKKKREDLEEAYKREIPLVAESSMEVLKEFEALEDDYEAI